MRRTFREAANTFLRAPLLSALSVTTIAFSLFAFGLFGLVALNIRDALQKVEERVEIRAFIVDGTDATAVAAAAGDIAAFPEVQSVNLVSREQALQRARQELGEFRDVFEAGVLPASIDVKLKPGSRDPATVQQVAERLKSYPFIDDVRYGEEWITQLHRLRNIAGVAGLALGLAFAAVAVIIIGATIRMAVLARAEEIAIMRLVGATDGYIRRPFLLEGFFKGVAGGALALALTWFATQLIDRYLHFQTVFFSPSLAALGIVAGALIGVLGSAVSVGRHLRRV
ncbi:MAG TPA: permease-like cell division protein FtsX [Gemmatimonadaceae bacterium]|jgi:cell division transport system permease protein|nr:permease-like cell division protein FtsX [Gemmatimonadaceae bacterium]